MTNQTKAKIGDTIVIIHSGLMTPFGEKYIVIECPHIYKGDADVDKPEHVWVADRSGFYWLLPVHYRIEKVATIEPKPGDTILITSLNNRDALKKFVVGKVGDDEEQNGLRRIVCTNGIVRYLYEEEYEVIEPSDTVAKPGDTIIITDLGLTSDIGKKYIVVEPACLSNPPNDTVNCIYVDTNFGKVFFYHRTYETIKRTNTPTLVSCLDCHGKGTIDLFTFTVKCKCNDNG